MCVKLQFAESHMTLSPEHLLDSPVRETERGRSAKTWMRKCWPCRGWGGEEAGIRGALNLPDDWLDPSGEDRPLLTWAAPGGHLFSPRLTSPHCRVLQGTGLKPDPRPS